MEELGGVGGGPRGTFILLHPFETMQGVSSKSLRLAKMNWSSWQKTSRKRRRRIPT